MMARLPGAILPGAMPSLLFLATAGALVISGSAGAGVPSASPHGAPSDRGEVWRWSLFGGEFEFREDLDWLLGSYADLAREFVYKITPTGFPWDPLIDIFTGSSNIIQASLEILKSEGGILGVTLVFLLLGVLLPIVGVFFFLCRCCGQCGAVLREDRARELACCTGNIMGAFLLVFSLAVLIASCFTILSGERLSQSVMHFEGTVNSIMDDIDTFQGELLDDLRQVGNLSSIVQDAMKTLEDAENAIFGPLTSHFESTAVPLNSTLSQLRDDLANPLTALPSIAGPLATTVAQLQTDGSAYQTAVNDVAVSLSEFRSRDCSGSLPDTLYGVCAFIPDHAPFQTVSFSSMLSLYDFSSVLVYPTVVNTALTTFLDILSAGDGALNEAKSAVGNASDEVFQDVGSILTDAQETVARSTNEFVSGLEESLGESLDTAAFRDQIGEYVDVVEEYDTYSYAAFIVFASLGFIMSVLSILGLLFGACGYSKTRRPSERTNSSECGGQFMIGATWWTFVFAILFCLPTAVWFFVGANVTLLCDAMVDSTILDKVVDNSRLWGGQTLLDSVVQFGDSPLNLTARHFIEDCQENHTMYEALHLSSVGLLDSAAGVDIQEFMPYVDTFSNNITAMITDLDLLGPADLSLLVPAISPPAFPIISLVHSTEILKDSTEAVPIQDAIDGLNVFINKTWEAYEDHGASQPDFQQQVDYAEDIITELQSLETVRASLLTLLDTYASQVTFFEATFYEIQNFTTDALPDIEVGADDLQTLSSGASAIVISSLDIYVDDVVAKTEELITGPIDKIENEIGRCGVVADSYETVVTEICVHFLTGFNALWFSTGIISLCCLPMIILNVRLTKYVRRSRPPEGDMYQTASP